MAPKKYPDNKPLPLHKGMAQGDSYDKASSESRVGGSKKDKSGGSNK